MIFRSSDPSIWDSDAHDAAELFAVPIKTLPDDCPILRIRADQNHVVIIPMTKAHLKSYWEGPRFGWNGTNSHRADAYHLGIFGKTMRVRDGQTMVTDADLAGWGFGHRHLVGGQGCSWAGQNMNVSVLEISVKSIPLTKAEGSYLLPW